MIQGVPKAVKYLCNNYNFKSLLDLGCGKGQYHKHFSKNVDILGVDAYKRIETENLPNVKYENKNIFEFSTEEKFDCVFCSHVIEHIADTESFLKHFFSFVKEDGVFCIFYPPLKQNIVGGHVHIFNHGLIAYHLVRLGIDCTDAKVIECGHTQGIMGNYKTFEVPQLTYNRYELDRLSKWFPFPVSHAFNGSNPRGVIRL